MTAGITGSAPGSKPVSSHGRPVSYLHARGCANLCGSDPALALPRRHRRSTSPGKVSGRTCTADCRMHPVTVLFTYSYEIFVTGQTLAECHDRLALSRYVSCNPPGPQGIERHRFFSVTRAES